MHAPAQLSSEPEKNRQMKRFAFERSPVERVAVV
jgi:hypothetical protein